MEVIKKYIVYGIVLILIILALLYCNRCSDDPIKELNALICQSLKDDQKISEQEWNATTEFLLRNQRVLKERYGFFFNNDAIDVDKVKEYILDQKGCYDESIIPTIWTPSETVVPLLPKLFIENSYSMDGYDSGAGQLSHVLKNIIGYFDLPPDWNEIFIVNDKVIKYENTMSQINLSVSLFKEIENYGSHQDKQYTNFEDIFSKLNNCQNNSQINILFSDLTYSKRDYKNETVEKIRNEIYSITNEAFRRTSEEHSVLVAKFYSDFKGTYYDYKDASHRLDNKIYRRPYYIVIFGTNQVINNLFKSKKYQNIIDFEKLPNDPTDYEDYYLFKKPEDSSPQYSVIFSYENEKSKGRFLPTNRDEIIIEIEDITTDPVTNEITIPIAIDFSDIFDVSLSYFQDLSNYEDTNVNGFNIISVLEIDKNGKDKSIKDKYPWATHILWIKSENQTFSTEELKIRLKRELPKWVYETQCQDDASIDPENFNNKTFAFEELMKGIFIAYRLNNYKYYFEIVININE